MQPLPLDRLAAHILGAEGRRRRLLAAMLALPMDAQDRGAVPIPGEGVGGGGAAAVGTTHSVEVLDVLAEGHAHARRVPQAGDSSVEAPSRRGKQGQPDGHRCQRVEAAAHGAAPGTDRLAQDGWPFAKGIHHQLARPGVGFQISSDDGAGNGVKVVREQAIRCMGFVGNKVKNLAHGVSAFGWQARR